MTYSIEIWTAEGDFVSKIGPFFSITSARQGMLDHSSTVDLPAEDPWFGPDINVLEGWFVSRAEYLIGETQ